MKKIIFLFCLFNFVNVFEGFSQELIATSPLYKKPKSDVQVQQVFLLGDGFATLASDPLNRRLFFQKFDEQLLLTQTTKLDMQIAGRRASFGFATQFGGQIYVFSGLKDALSRRDGLYVQLIDSRTLTPSGTPTPVLENTRNNRETSALGYHISRDSSFLMVYAYTDVLNKGGGLLNTGKRENQRVALSVFEPGMKLLWKKNLTLPYDGDLIEGHRFLMGEDGNVYVIAKVYEGKYRDKVKGEPNYSYKLFAISPVGEELKEIQLSVPDKFLVDMALEINGKGQLVCAGYYSERGTASIAGLFFFSYDTQTGKVGNRATVPFSPDFLAQIRTRRENRKDQEASDYRVNELVLRSDGGALLIGEKFSESIYYDNMNPAFGAGMGVGVGMGRGYGFNGMNNSRVQYFYGNIALININPDASTQWALTVPKEQYSTYPINYYIPPKQIDFSIFDQHTSFFHASIGSKIYLFFNEGRNLQQSMFVTIDKEGNMKSGDLLNRKDDRVVFTPKGCRLIADDLMFVNGTHRRKFKVGILKL